MGCFFSPFSHREVTPVSTGPTAQQLRNIDNNGMRVSKLIPWGQAAQLSGTAGDAGEAGTVPGSTSPSGPKTLSGSPCWRRCRTPFGPTGLLFFFLRKCTPLHAMGALGSLGGGVLSTPGGGVGFALSGSMVNLSGWQFPGGGDM